MDFKQWLAEMPLATYKYNFSRPRFGSKLDNLPTAKDRFSDFDVYGSQLKQKDVNGYFSQRDRTAISHPKTMQTLERVLSRHDFKFNILMVEAGKFDTEQIWTPTTNRVAFEMKIYEYMAANMIPKDDHITYVKNGSTGHVMSPWMILHTMGHALFGKIDNRQWFDALADMVTTGWKTLMRNFVFKSANADSKENDIGSVDEFIYELTAEYLWNGKIRLKENAKSYDVKKIETLIHQRLEAAIGTVVSDFFA